MEATLVDSTPAPPEADTAGPLGHMNYDSLENLLASHRSQSQNVASDENSEQNSEQPLESHEVIELQAFSTFSAVCSPGATSGPSWLQPDHCQISCSSSSRVRSWRYMLCPPCASRSRRTRSCRASQRSAGSPPQRWAPDRARHGGRSLSMRCRCSILR